MNRTPLEMPPIAQDARRNVSIIGAGFVGLCTALWLQRAGHHVTLIDPAPPLKGVDYREACSYGNACTIAPHGVVPMATPGIIWDVPGMLLNPDGPLSIRWRYLPQMIPWLLAFMAASRKHEAERIAGVLGKLLHQADAAWRPLMEQAGATHMRRENGCLYLFKSENEYRAAAYGNALREKNGVIIDELSRADVAALEPNLAPLYVKGILYRDAYTISSPHALASALAEAFVAAGGVFVQQKAETLEIVENGVKVFTTAAPILADHLVVAAGAHSKRFTRQAGDRVPLDTERGYHVLFPDSGELLSRPVCYPHHGFYMVPMQDGLRAVGTVEFGGLKAPPNSKRTAMISRTTSKFLPALGKAGDQWMGFRPSMPDSLPVIGPSAKKPRITYALGHGHLGLTLSAVTGYLVAQQISGQDTFIDTSDLRPGRF